MTLSGYEFFAGLLAAASRRMTEVPLRTLEHSTALAFGPIRDHAARHGVVFCFRIYLHPERDSSPAFRTGLVATIAEARDAVRLDTRTATVHLTTRAHPLAAPDAALFERWEALRAGYAAALAAPWDENNWYRAGGGVTCATCGGAYLEHPSDRRESWLTLLCDGQRVKL